MNKLTCNIDQTTYAISILLSFGKGDEDGFIEDNETKKPAGPDNKYNILYDGQSSTCD